MVLEKGIRETYSDDVVVFHEAWLVTCKETEHSKYEGHYGACRGEES